VKRTSILALLLSTTLLMSLGCGDAAVGNLQTLALSASGSSLKGEGGTLQLVVIGNFSKGSTRDLTNRSTFTVTPLGVDLTGAALLAPPQTITISSTGLVTAVSPFACSFHNTISDLTKPPAYVLVGSYQIVATFQGIASQPVFIGVASAAGDGPGSACGP
jgi:hypothetical protein